MGGGGTGESTSYHCYVISRGHKTLYHDRGLCFLGDVQNKGAREGDIYPPCFKKQDGSYTKCVHADNLL